MADYKLIGHNYQTPDILAKVTGRAKYAEDYRADGMLFCKLLLSPMPHARIRNIDASAALKMPGVHAVLTADDVPRYSCSVLTHSVRGQKIVTVEGLASADGKLHAVQQGIVDEQGFQCAFCMSGFIMATVGYLKTNPNPTREALAHGISGNLCRCQDYNKILTAMMRGAELLRKV